MLRSEDANGWNSGGGGFFAPFGSPPPRPNTTHPTPPPPFFLAPPLPPCAAAPFFGGLESPGGIAGRHTPVLAIVSEEIIGPGLLDDAEAFLERGPVGSIDLIVLMGQRAVNPVGLLRHDIDPAPLISAREAGIGPPA